MKFLLAPLPSLKSLLVSLSFKKIDEEYLSKPWLRTSDTSIWFSKSAWSLAAIAIWQRIRLNKKEIYFWIPDYFCNTSLSLLRYLDVRLVFYPIQEDREPNYSACKELQKANPIDVFVLVHYFGKASNANRAFEFCSGKNAILVEDAAHVLKPIKGIGEKGDFILYSPHKHLPIPDGAVLVIRNSGPSKIEWGTKDGNSILEHCDALGSDIKTEKMVATKWILKRSLQKFGLRNVRKFNPEFLEDVSIAVRTQRTMSNLSKRLLNDIVPEMNQVARKKSEIQKIWDQVLLEKYKIISDRDSDWTPYLSEYSFDNIESANSLFAKLAQDELPVSTWPDLPPEVLTAEKEHSTAIRLRKTSFFLPLHSSVSESEISKIAFKDSKKSFLKIIESTLNQTQWDNELESIVRTNLLQSWSYGDAKYQIEGWKPKRILLMIEGKKVALVQILSKTYFYFFRVIRINRGPLYFRDVNLEEKSLVLDYLTKFASIWKGSVLFFNPEMDLEGRNLLTLYQKGFKKRNQLPWSSSYVDLTQSIDELRKNLDSKWRNMLNVSEKNDLTIEVSEDDESFRWMLEKYSELMSEKKFNGISIPLLKRLRECFSDREKPLILIAKHKEERVACICVTVSNQTGMYLVGWNGEEGRKLKANQFLLWNAIVALKERNYIQFDLGGIDEVNTPSVAEFKLGINGERYTLAGEFIRF
ncbi:glycosyltransferase [Leptospira tipperaryensis]|uniref:Glycosyltransferase n=1 Tax=Leptospira tipperaryensis TaxID=2564040 RepID=A0A1D7UVY0_9LEPT|nr:GNAT family N-acetyltransferase [Leptospira tipperaryensis]AOP33704.1 glycosyltransferase [Leptospira tipperaryensis]